jgi:hypothetical protein
MAVEDMTASLADRDEPERCQQPVHLAEADYRNPGQTATSTC